MKNKIEITRSFSQKVSLPDNQYQMRDFFCSAKTEVPEDEVADKSKELDKLCQREVEKSIEEYLKAKEPKSPEAIEAIKQWEEHQRLVSETGDIKAEEEKSKTLQ